jgi:riboflavin biosynthesis pyrimidine reductase
LQNCQQVATVGGHGTTKESQEVKISIRATRIRGQLRHVVSRFVNGKRKRNFYATKKAAADAKNSLEEQHRIAGEEWIELPTADKAEIIKVLSEMAERGLTLRAVWEAYKNGTGERVKESRTLKDAIDETIRAKRSGKRRLRYLTGLEEYLRLFARGRESLPVSRISVADIDKWFESREEADSHEDEQPREIVLDVRAVLPPRLHPVQSMRQGGATAHRDREAGYALADSVPATAGGVQKD